MRLFSCIIDVCWIIVECLLVGFDWVSPIMQFKFCTSHVDAYVSFHSYFQLGLCFSLSLSQIDCAWHLKCVNPLRARILFKVPVLLLLLIPFPLLTFDFVMRRPERTSWRTLRNVAFIQSAMLFYQTFLTLLSPSLFGLRVGNLYMREP